MALEQETNMIKGLVFCLAVAADVDAFTSVARPFKLSTAALRSRTIQLPMSEVIDPAEVIPLGEGGLATPEGYGFSSPMTRILSATDGNGGYYRALSSQTVTDVMGRISTSPEDVALVFDESSDKFLGLFTATDYIKVRPFQMLTLSSTELPNGSFLFPNFWVAFCDIIVVLYRSGKRVK